ncbi:hypothetical protein GWO09_08390 [candidate division KSB1 bacterium]|nr:hypothetical protein [candidate division KSB1 bacterium]
MSQSNFKFAHLITLRDTKSVIPTEGRNLLGDAPWWSEHGSSECTDLQSGKERNPCIPIICVLLPGCKNTVASLADFCAILSHFQHLNDKLLSWYRLVIFGNTMVQVQVDSSQKTSRCASSKVLIQGELLRQKAARSDAPKPCHCETRASQRLEAISCFWKRPFLPYRMMIVSDSF